EIAGGAACGRQDQASAAAGDVKGYVRTCGVDRLVSGAQKSGGAEARSGDLARYRPVLAEEGAHLIGPRSGNLSRGTRFPAPLSPRIASITLRLSHAGARHGPF